MTLSEKIMILRKQKGWSQEDLADQLGISRQSVSKWEAAASMPDLDKIVRMSQLFDVTTDYLLVDDNTPKTETESCAAVGRVVTKEDADCYLRKVEDSAKPMATAVMALVLSPTPLILLGGLADLRGTFSDSLAGGLGISILLLVVAAAVFVLVRLGMGLSQFEFLEKEDILLQSGVASMVKQKQAQFHETFRNRISIGVVLCILGVLPLFIAAAFDAGDLIYIFCVDILLIVIACGVWQFVWSGMIYDSYQRLLQEGDYTPAEKQIDNGIGAIYWPVITAVYLLVSFVTMGWERTWIIWPCAGVLYAAMVAVIKNRKK